MGLVKCVDCLRDVSDRASACPHCGGPMGGSAVPAPAAPAPTKIELRGQEFIGTRALIIQLGVRAIQAVNYRVDSADAASGIVSFTTGMTMGSWSGVTGSLHIVETGQNTFTVSGTAKQNVKGGQIIALDIGGEAKAKVQKVIDMMRTLARRDGQPQAVGPVAAVDETAGADDNAVIWIVGAVTVVVLILVLIMAIPNPGAESVSTQDAAAIDADAAASEAAAVASEAANAAAAANPARTNQPSPQEDETFDGDEPDAYYEATPPADPAASSPAASSDESRD